MASGRRYRLAPLPVALGLLLLLSAAFYLFQATGHDPYEQSLAAAERAFADADYLQALKCYDEAAEQQPTAFAPRLGLALTLLQLQRPEEALAAFDRAQQVTDSDEQRAFLLANRGILHDRAGRYAAALVDYDAALALSSRIAAGPGWVDRFTHNQAGVPATVSARADYLRQQLARPEGERLLRLPAADAQQFPYRP